MLQISDYWKQEAKDGFLCREFFPASPTLEVACSLVMEAPHGSAYLASFTFLIPVLCWHRLCGLVSADDVVTPHPLSTPCMSAVVLYSYSTISCSPPPHCHCASRANDRLKCILREAQQGIRKLCPQECWEKWGRGVGVAMTLRMSSGHVRWWTPHPPMHSFCLLDTKVEMFDCNRL